MRHSRSRSGPFPARVPLAGTSSGSPAAAWQARFRQAAALQAAGKTHQAIAVLEDVVARAPDARAPRYELAVLYDSVGRFGDALRELNEIAQRVPNDSKAATDVASMLYRLGHCALAFTAVSRALSLDRSNLAAMIVLAEILKETGDVAAARDVYEAALSLAPDDAKLNLHYGMLLVASGEWTAGWPRLEHREAFIGRTVLYKEIPRTPRWTGRESLEGKRLLIVHEQGFGDSLMGVRFADTLAAAGAIVHFRTRAALVPLVRTARGVAECTADGTSLPAHDLHIPLMSLMQALTVTPEQLSGAPYLEPVGECPPHIAALLPRDGVPTVALTWAGNPQHVNDLRRSIRGDLLAPLVERDGIRWAAIQKTPPVEQVLPGALRSRLIDVGVQCDSFNDTAHALRRVDLLVTVDTSVAHLAGAMGVRTLLCLPSCPDFRWGLRGTTTPWYDSLTLLRQREGAGWEDVLAEVRAHIDTLRRDPQPAGGLP